MISLRSGISIDIYFLQGVLVIIILFFYPEKLNKFFDLNNREDCRNYLLSTLVAMYRLRINFPLNEYRSIIFRLTPNASAAAVIEICVVVESVSVSNIVIGFLNGLLSTIFARVSADQMIPAFDPAAGAKLKTFLPFSSSIKNSSHNVSTSVVGDSRNFKAVNVKFSRPYLFIDL